MAATHPTSDTSNRSDKGLGRNGVENIGKYWDYERRQEEAYMEMSDRASQERYAWLEETDD